MDPTIKYIYLVDPTIESSTPLQNVDQVKITDKYDASFGPNNWILFLRFKIQACSMKPVKSPVHSSVLEVIQIKMQPQELSFKF